MERPTYLVCLIFSGSPRNSFITCGEIKLETDTNPEADAINSVSPCTVSKQNLNAAKNSPFNSPLEPVLLLRQEVERG